MCETYDATAPGTAKFNFENLPSHVPIPVEYPFTCGLYFFKMSEIEFIKQTETETSHNTDGLWRGGDMTHSSHIFLEKDSINQPLFSASAQAFYSILRFVRTNEVPL